MKQSTNKLNQAIERMATGVKINHAKDNAANYNIATNMTTKLGALQVAEDNCANGMDLVITAMEFVSIMQDRASRLQALSTQARNGTYGAKSLSAINAEAEALMAEISRLYETSEYNGKSLFNEATYPFPDYLPKAGKSGFIDETAVDPNGLKAGDNGFIENAKTYTDTQVADMKKVSVESTFNSGEKYSISSPADLQKLADYIKAGNDTTGIEFVLAEDIDLSSISNWTPIGENSTNPFKGIFDGNGHVIKNLTINNLSRNYAGLFGYTDSGAVIKNIGIEGGFIKARASCAGLVGYSTSTNIENCYSTIDVTGYANVGGLIGGIYESVVTNCYTTGNVKGEDENIGGLIGSTNCYSTPCSILNCYTTVNVVGEYYQTGGLVGYNRYAYITNCYTTGDVTGVHFTGGIAGRGEYQMTNCYSTGNVTGTYSHVGGIAGYAYDMISCYSTGKITGGASLVGGLAGSTQDGMVVENSYSTSQVSGVSSVGGLIGESKLDKILNSYASGTVSGEKFVGGLIGEAEYDRDYKTLDIIDTAVYSKVSGVEANSTGSLIGGATLTYNDLILGNISTSQVLVTNQDCKLVGGAYKYSSSTYTLLNRDFSSMLSGVSVVALESSTTTLQIGTKSNDNSQLSFKSAFQYDLSGVETGIETEEAFNSINEFLNLLSEKSTELGAVQNRLESALDEISTQYENIVSSRSTLQDADIAEVSSEYIRQQILQQASATLMATANQSASIALSLI